jgi:hypothetical protein
MLAYMKRYNHDYVEKTKEAQNVDKILSKKILQHLHTFFNKNANKKNKSRKIIKIKNRAIKNKTIKKI